MMPIEVSIHRTTAYGEDEDTIGTLAHIVQQATLDNPALRPANFAEHLVYVCNHGIDTSELDELANPAGVKLFQATPTLIYRFGSAGGLYGQIRAAIDALPNPEIHFFHTALPATAANRLAEGGGIGTPNTGSWAARPSAALGALMASVILANYNTYFDGIMCDEAQANIPTNDWTVWKTAADGPANDGERPAYDVLWDAKLNSFFSALKTGWGTTKGVMANTAGATYPSAQVPVAIDGIMIESAHIVTMGEPAAIALYTTQYNTWANNPLKFGSFVLNSTMDYELQIAGLVLEGQSLPTS